ncbi:MAG: SusC/RagA family TonB-linked outer membrane protein [Cyclobacteriaceae bacterium]
MNRLLIGLLCLLLSFSVSAQVLSLKGRIIDSRTKDNLQGVVVKVSGSEDIIRTDENGIYELKLNDGYEFVIFSLPGYQPQTIHLNGEKEFDLELVEHYGRNEKVTVGFGQQTKEELTSSISQIKTEEVTPAPLVSLEQGSQGMATGLMVTNSSGKLGGATTVRVRGGSSLSNSNNPLYVIDGVPLASGSQSNLNPNNIASIEVLKDASAAAIYGSRAANGVVIITTRSGQQGKMKIDVDYQMGVSQTPKYLDLYDSDEYNQQLIEFLVRATPFEAQITKSKLAQWQQSGATTIDLDGGSVDLPAFYSDLTHNTDWQKEVFRTGISHRANVGVSGANETLSYFGSVAYNTQQGILVGNKYDRLNGSFSINSQISSKISANLSVNYIYAKENKLLDEQDLGAPLQAIVLPPSDSYDPSNNYTLRVRSLEYNPLTEVNFSDNIGLNNSIIGSLGVKYQIAEDLSFDISGGLDFSDQRDERRQGPETREGSVTGRSQLGLNDFRNYIINGYLTYKPDVGEDHKFSIIVGSSYQKSTIESSFRAARVNSISELEGIQEGNSTLSVLDIPNSSSAFVSSFWRINYGVHERFNFQVSGRVDGSSKFSPDNRFGFFPAVSAGWLLSDEPTIAHLHFMDHFKIKASYGLIGNTPLDDFLYRSNYFNLTYGADEGLGLLNLSNSDLKWETTSQLDIGFEVEFINRIRGSFDYYVKRTRDLLFPVPVSQTSGFATVFKNVGSMENIGLEITLGATNIETENFTWTTDFNISFNDNLVTDLGGNQLIVGANAYLEGQPSGVFYMRRYMGVDDQTGAALYDDGLGGTTTNWEAAPRQIVGDPNPSYFGGLNNNLSFGNFDLSFLIQFVGDVDLYYETGEFLSNSGILNLSQSASQVDRWYSAGDQADYPVLDPFQENTNASSRWIQDGQYYRLKNLTLTYNLPESAVSGWGLDYMKVYVGGQNLLTKTNYTGYDPDVNYTDPINGVIGQNINRGIDNFTAPQPRIFMAGIKIGF